MEEIRGKVIVSNKNQGSKSEGETAVLHTANGKKYTLYRSGMLPTNDPFLTAFDNKEIIVKGDIEENTGHICVEAVVSEDGTEIVANKIEAPSPVQIVIKPLSQKSNEAETKRYKRLPRKLKKALKKNKN